MERLFYWYDYGEINIFLCQEGAGEKESSAKPEEISLENFLDDKNNAKDEVFLFGDYSMRSFLLDQYYKKEALLLKIGA